MHLWCYLLPQATMSLNMLRKSRIHPLEEFFPHDIPIPKTHSIDMAIKSASELTHALQNPTPTSPFHNFRGNIVVALDTCQRSLANSKIRH